MQQELIDQAHKLYSEIINYAPELVKALIFLFAGLWVSNRIDRWVKIYFDKKDFDVSLEGFLKSLISVGLKIFVLITFAGMVGLPSASLFAIFGAAGLAIGLAIQGSLSNFAGGVLILLYKPFRIGDNISALDETGVVTEIQIFNTILLTAEKKTVILPNGALSNGKIINISRHGTLRLEYKISIAFEENLDKVRKLIIDILESDNRVLKDPPPTVNILEFGDSTLLLTIRAYALLPYHSEVFFEVFERIRKSFIDNGISPVINKNTVK